MSSGGMIVEFCGLPGSGKTVLAREVAEALVTRGARAVVADDGVCADVPAGQRVTRRAMLAAIQGLTRPIASGRMTAAILRSRQARFMDAVRAASQWSMAQRLFAEARRDGGVHLFQEGVIQTLWTVGLRGEAERAMLALSHGGAWIAPDVVVFVDAPVGVVLNRLRSRPSIHSRTQRLSRSEQENELERGRALLAELIASWEKRAGSGWVLRIENPDGDSPSGDAARLADRITSLQRWRGAAAQPSVTDASSA